MNNSLVIGNTSQLSFYFPDEYVKISSRNINFNSIKKNFWDRIFLCFGESRKFIEDKKIYEKINYDYTLNIIEELKNNCNHIILFSSCELWNQYSGAVDISYPFMFFKTPYLESKYKITNHILNNKEKYKNVIIAYPFNFNSIHRNNNFLFGKIFNSLVNKEKIEIGDTYFYRDIVHPKFVVKELIKADSDLIIGSGRLTFVNDFIRDLYNFYNLDYEKYIVENLNKFNEYEKKKEYYLKSNKNLYNYNNLFNDTTEEINLRLMNKE